MFKVFFQTYWIGVTIYYICRILGKRNKVVKDKCLIISTVILEGYLSMYILQIGDFCHLSTRQILLISIVIHANNNKD